MSFDGDVLPLMTAIHLNGEDSCSGSATTTSGPLTTTTMPQTTTTSETTQQSTLSSTITPQTTTMAHSTTSTTQQPIPTTTTSSSGSSCLIEITNSWANNIQGKIYLTVPSDITDFSIVLKTDIALTRIQVILQILKIKCSQIFFSFTLQMFLLQLAQSSISLIWIGSVDCRLARHLSWSLR